jgi:YHS domain-containing protein
MKQFVVGTGVVIVAVTMLASVDANGSADFNGLEYGFAPGAAQVAGPRTAPKTAPYGGQRTCPVLGEKLGAHGSPIPVSVSGQTIYVCCRGCVNKVKANPTPYLSKVAAERRQTSGTAPVKGNQGQAAFGGQKTCPVLDEKLGAHGNPVPVSVSGQTIYVCCRGCVNKLKANPTPYLAKVAAERRQTNGGSIPPKVVPQ